jgi:hypothetical protein
MIILHNKKEGEVIMSLKLSCGINTYQDIQDYVADRKEIYGGRVSISIYHLGKYNYISSYQLDQVIPIEFTQSKIYIEIKPSIIEMEIVSLFNKLEIE